MNSDVRRRAEEIRSKLRQEKGAVVETGSLKKRKADSNNPTKEFNKTHEKINVVCFSITYLLN